MRATPPSTRWYRLSWSFVALGLVAAGAWWPYATTRVFDEVEAFTRLGPSGGAVALASTGVHTIWVEGACLSCHDNNSQEYRKAARVSLVAPDRRPVPLRPAPARVFNTARREGRSIWLFDARKVGRYELSVDFDTSGDWDNVVPSSVAVSRGIALPTHIARTMAELAGTGLAAALSIAVLTALARHRYYATQPIRP